MELLPTSGVGLTSSGGEAAGLEVRGKYSELFYSVFVLQKTTVAEAGVGIPLTEEEQEQQEELEEALVVVGVE